MPEMKVKIKELEPMHVAVVRVNSRSPEEEALGKLWRWAGRQGLLVAGVSHRLFGYDSCQPYPDHVYTALLTVDAAIRADDEVEVRDLPGGKYAVTRVKGVEDIGPGWERLEAWRAAGYYERGSQPSLEEFVTPPDTPPDELVLDLHLALAD